MPSARTVRSLNRETAAYLAGLVDGEGTITLTARHRGERRSIVVSISNTDRALLEYVRETVGAGRITTKRTNRENHAASFAFTLGNRHALSLLSQIACFLKTYRAQRAALALSRYTSVTPRNGKYSVEMERMKEEFEREFLALGPGPRGLKTGRLPLRSC